jgi:hypothetical protein
VLSTFANSLFRFAENRQVTKPSRHTQNPMSTIAIFDSHVLGTLIPLLEAAMFNVGTAVLKQRCTVSSHD